MEPNRSDKEFMRSILQATEHILECRELVSVNSFLTKPSIYRDAILFNIDLIAFSASHLSENFLTTYPEVPWLLLRSIQDGYKSEAYNLFDAHEISFKFLPDYRVYFRFIVSDLDSPKKLIRKDFTPKHIFLAKKLSAIIELSETKTESPLPFVNEFSIAISTRKSIRTVKK